jgi:hypothetical protein
LQYSPPANIAKLSAVDEKHPTAAEKAFAIARGEFVSLGCIALIIRSTRVDGNYEAVESFFEL